eukprot:TRINITY_DN3680_c1_g1_i2.p1 TRINITY_DN3680_c1_g1~~TRINITY_DN3680_c1_g1_i2.p1  ORF type:complete len:443 (-),score=91.20 TRINITY_DN3680_c1_g1_i2:564-1781(-)
MFARLQGSGLPQEVLMMIWELSDMDHDGNLTLKEFYINSYLVNLAQTGVPLPETLPPSLLASIDIPTETLPTSVPTPSPTSTPTSAPTSTPAPTSVPASQAYTGSVSASLDPWTVSLDRFIAYKQSFDSMAQLLPQGPAARAETAAPLLAQSGLHQELLSTIWALSDIEGDGTLSLPEFVVAMHLVTAAVNGVPIPPQLPESLVQSVMHLLTNNQPNVAVAQPPLVHPHNVHPPIVDPSSYAIPLPILANPPPRVAPIVFNTPAAVMLDPIVVDFSPYKLQQEVGTENPFSDLLLSSEHVEVLSDELLAKKYGLSSNRYDPSTVDQEMEKLNLISDEHQLQELLASIDQEIAFLEQETKKQADLTVDLSSKIVIAETNVLKSQKARKESSKSLQKNFRFCKWLSD